MFSLKKFENLIGIEDVSVKNVVIDEDGKVRIFVELENKTVACPHCYRHSNRVINRFLKSVRDLDIFGKTCFIDFEHKLIECSLCLKTFMEPLSFVDYNRLYTKRFENEVYKLCRATSDKFAGSHYGLSDKTARNIFHKCFKARLNAVSLQPIERIGIDEIALHKGHGNFIMVITDLTNKKIIEILLDRRKETLENWIKNLTNEFKNCLKSVSIDLWKGYRSAVKSLLPDVEIVADRFHVQQNLNRSLDNIRKIKNLNLQELNLNADDDEINEQINLKYILLKNREDLSSKQQRILGKIFKIYPDLKEYYELKEEFREIFNTSENAEIGKKRVHAWLLKVVRNDNQKFFGFVKTLLNWDLEITNYFHDKITSGFVEGVNNKLKLINRTAYGFSNFENFKIKSMDCFLD